MVKEIDNYFTKKEKKIKYKSKKRKSIILSDDENNEQSKKIKNSEEIIKSNSLYNRISKNKNTSIKPADYFANIDNINTSINNIDDNNDDKNNKSSDKKLNFIKALLREGPKLIGERKLPVGKEDCLMNLTFVISGILEYFERDTIIELIEKYGGRHTGSVSGKTSYLILGREPGESKISKAKSIGTKIINENQFYDIITNSLNNSKLPSNIKQNNNFLSPDSKKINKSCKISPKKYASPLLKSISEKKSDDGNVLWVDKYRPNKISEIVGQNGVKSCASKLKEWLINYKNNTYKAALLSGGPGIGKTTTAIIVCKELEYDIVEMNASDSRSKNILDHVLSSSISNMRITSSSMNSVLKRNNKSVIILDEIDGISGNEDRGGIQFIISLIKLTSIPIICICNDRQNTKIKSLQNYCLDIRFNKPRIETIRSYMMVIAEKEGIDIQQQAMDQIITACHNDIRQILNNLQMWSCTKKQYNYDDSKKEAFKCEKDITHNSFDITRRLFTASLNNNLNINNRIDLFFNDYQLLPLLMYENYLRIITKYNESELLHNIILCIDSMSMGCICDSIIKRTNIWSLLPLYGYLSTVYPSYKINGILYGMVEFPKVLSNISKSNKTKRILLQLINHCQLKINISLISFNLDYLLYFGNYFYQLLFDNDDDIVSCINDIIKNMNEYHFTKSDFDNILLLSQTFDVNFKPIPTKVKTLLTKTCNKYHLNDATSSTKSKRSLASLTDDMYSNTPSDDDEDIQDAPSTINNSKRVNTTARASTTTRANTTTTRTNTTTTRTTNSKGKVKKTK